jgi:hypothetical protein
MQHGINIRQGTACTQQHSLGDAYAISFDEPMCSLIIG